MGEARHFKFRVLMDTEPYSCMHGIILPPKGIYSGSCDVFKFWEISDNIPETVQYRGLDEY